MENINASPLLTIAVVTYNHGRYIKNCLNSIAEQTFNNIDLVVFDDCSCDFNADEIQNFIESTNKFQSYTVKQAPIHIGTVAAYQQALQYAEGEYILFIGGDDYISDENILSKLAVELQASSADVVQTQACLLKSDSVFPTAETMEALNDKKYHCLFTDFLIRYQSQFMCVQAAFFRTSILRSLDVFRSNYQFAVDWLIYLNLLFNNCSFDFIPYVVANLHDEGAYRANCVGNLYIRKGYFNEAAQIIREIAISEHKDSLSEKNIVLLHDAANKIELVSDARFEWGFYSLADKLKWRIRRKTHYLTHFSYFSKEKTKKYSLKQMFFVIVALFLLYIASTMVFPNQVVTAEHLIVLVSVLFAAKVFFIVRNENNQVIVDYSTLSVFLATVVFSVVCQKYFSIEITVSNGLLVVLLLLCPLYVIAVAYRLGVKVCKRLLRKYIAKKGV